MNYVGKRALTLSTLALVVTTTPYAAALSWSDTYIGYRFGAEFTEPNNPNHIQKHIIQFTHTSGYAYGQNFLNVDLLQSDSNDKANGGDKGATEAYVTYRHQLHLGKVFETDLGFGPVKEVALSAGFDWNTKNTAFAPKKRLLLVGPTLKFDLPRGFADLSLFYAYEKNHCGLTPCGLPGNQKDISFDPYYVVSAAWGIPFMAGLLPMKFQGFANYNGEKGRDYFNVETKPEVLMRSSLMLDIGQLAFNKQNTLWAGVGYEYWHNKFGNHGKAGTNTTAPTFQLEWHF
ncbi:hypothetical protein [Zobellella maritima]|uniref:hypothetical protein n=1 Tax=Zobellella maritima TaxID=2059725 RepID=UPI0018E52329|nr:hypothetical protein [Zobellella maritima]